MYKLTYFNVRGLAEISRILFALAKIDYEDYRYPFEIINNEYKRDLFLSDQNSGKLDSSMGKLPVLTIKNDNLSIDICQSKAIERYLANKFGFMGENEIETARIDSICECIRDFRDSFYKLSEEDKVNYLKTTFKENLLKFIKILDQDSKFSIGNKISLADITIYNFISSLEKYKETINISEEFPKINEIINNVLSVEEIKNWISNRPQTIF